MKAPSVSTSALPTAMAQPDTAWNRICPYCGAEVQQAARRCWQCRQDFPAEGVDESEYRPTDPDASLAGTAAVLLTVGLGTVVISLIFFLLGMTMYGYFLLW